MQSHVGMTTAQPVDGAAGAVPRMHVMHAASGPPRLAANVPRPRLPVHSGHMAGLAEQASDKLYSVNSADVQAGKIALMRPPMWQQNGQFTTHQQTSSQQLQSMSAYVHQQPVVRTPMSSCGSEPDWSGFNGQLSYQQAHRHQLQRHLVPTSTVIRHQLPVYQKVIDKDMMLKHTFQQQHQLQQQRHLMHLHSVPHHHSTGNESYTVGGFGPAANHGCMIPLTSSYTAPASVVSSTV